LRRIIPPAITIMSQPRCSTHSPFLALAAWTVLAVPAVVAAEIASSTEDSADASTSAVGGEGEIENIVVVGVRERLWQAGALQDVIQKTELIDASLIRSRNAINLTEALAYSPGVRVSNECSMCGVKRLMLNGMRGEHTTILVDGIPVHTMLAGFYALDAIPTMGIERIEIARGAGASLLAPEAIGGTVNIVTHEATETALKIDVYGDLDGGYRGGALGTWISDSGGTRLTLIAQTDAHDQIDGDNNKVNEQPRQENDNLIVRVSQDLSPHDNVVARIARVESEIFGGPTVVGGIDGVLAGFDGVPSDLLFEADDVRRRYIGKPWETTEWIETARDEASLSWLHEFNERLNLLASASYSAHEQDSFYEGFDYQADDDMVHADLRLNFVANDRHHLVAGIDTRLEEMRSRSKAGAASPDYVADSFDYEVFGVYVQDTWSPNDRLEVAVALRVDSLQADFIDPAKPGVEIDETVLAPRLDARFRHDDQWTSRLSLGRGYRAPLSFFESDHGILDAGDGFAIDIDSLEDSLSGTYTLSYEAERLTTTASLAYTTVDNLSTIGETPAGVPLLTQLDEVASVVVADVSAGYRLGDDLALSLTVEHFEYDDAFKSSFSLAPVEDRATLSADYTLRRLGGWQFFASATWVGSRRLDEYGYEGWNVRGGLDPKASRAPAYVTADLRAEHEFGRAWSVYCGATNVFDYTQVKNEDTPLFWDAGDQYDVAYIYGPLRGREVYAGLTARF
jgi:outer membrane receptor for ferrienterochelin and colicin